MKVESEITMILPDGRNARLVLYRHHRLNIGGFFWVLKVNDHQVEVTDDKIDGLRMLDAARKTLLATGAKEQEVVC
jgi:hypothetical protein